MFKKFFSNKILIVLISVVLIAVFFVAIIFTFGESKDTEEPKDIVELKFIGESEFVINLDDEIPAVDVMVLVNGEKSKLEYKVSGEVNNLVPGIYEIVYKIEDEEIVSRIEVVDNISPKIKLKGKSKMSIFVSEKYKEPGYTATDNIDGNINKNVKVSGKVEQKVGTYKLKYTVEDLAGNTISATRTVTVKKNYVPRPAPVEKKDPPKKPVANASNEITDMVIVSNGIKVTSKYNLDMTSFSLINTSTDAVKNYDFTKSGVTYTTTLNLGALSNGTYDLYINYRSEEEESKAKAINKLSYFYKLGRTKIGNKLVTFNYDNNNVRIIVEDHFYQYDIFIDVGHGGGDPGAVNSTMQEKSLNLLISKYEKDRYVEHGLRVLMTRNGDSPELGLGPWTNGELARRAYATGWYGVVTHLVYSNHHNAASSSSVKGYEIIVPAALTKSQLSVEHNVLAAWKKVFNIQNDTRRRFYTRNYDNDQFYDKSGGQTYTFKNWYALNRYPYNYFNVKSTIYEGCFMSNPTEYKWYYNDKNWIKVSEAKIKAYVEALGKSYIAPRDPSEYGI